MPANIETFASHREPAWHGIGTIVDHAMTAEEALVLGGLNWDVDLFPVRTTVTVKRDIGLAADGHITEGRTECVPFEMDVPDTYAVVRDSDQSILGTVGKFFKPVQNRESFSFADGLVDSGDAKYETVGSLAGGRRVFMTMRVPRDILIAGVESERHDLYVLLANGHDGSMAFTAAVTPVRVVCQNTMNLALGSTTQQWKIRHFQNLDGKMAEARDALGLTFAYADAFEATMNELIEAEFTKAQYEKMVRDLFPAKATDDTDGPAQFTEEQAALVGVLEGSSTIDDAIRYTKYGALNAVREFDDWVRPVRPIKGGANAAELRTKATLFGRNVERSNKVLTYLSN